MHLNVPQRGEDSNVTTADPSVSAAQHTVVVVRSPVSIHWPFAEDGFLYRLTLHQWLFGHCLRPEKHGQIPQHLIFEDYETDTQKAWNAQVTHCLKKPACDAKESTTIWTEFHTSQMNETL